jgi:hypothetical protein
MSFVKNTQPNRMPKTSKRVFPRQIALGRLGHPRLFGRCYYGLRAHGFLLFSIGRAWKASVGQI